MKSDMTGRSDEQRANFNIMKAMGEYTRQDPVERCKTLTKFKEWLNGTPSPPPPPASQPASAPRDLRPGAGTVFKSISGHQDGYRNLC